MKRRWRKAAIFLCPVAFWGLGVLLWTGFSTGRLVETAIAPPFIVGFERFFTAPDADLVEGGNLLLSELRCVRCHQPDDPRSNDFPSHPGPNLLGINNRVHFGYLEEWLASPAKTTPGTTMPHLLSGETEEVRKETATALAHYLFSLEVPAVKPELSGSFENGRKLFHTVSCVACHAPEPGFNITAENSGGLKEELKIPSVPLGKPSDKYTESGLRDFLLDPLRVRPSGHMPRTPLSQEEASDLATYLLSGSGAPVEKVTPDTGLAAKGKRMFSDLGCVSCHAVPGATAPKFKTLSELVPADEEGCLSEHPLRGVPHYALSDQQRKALQAALTEVRTPGTLSAELQVERRMMALNCFACHQRDSKGGPDSGRNLYFVTDGADLGDEGRLPPVLTGVGRKLTSEAIESIVRGEEPARPYMTTRMPDFGAGHAAFFEKGFPEADGVAAERPEREPIGRAHWGRELTGIKGLSCISCHNLNGEKSIGIRAMDLALAPQRLRPEWFEDFLIDPPHFKPGTRMPSFWPDGKAIHPLIGRDTKRQIQSIWVYLSWIDQNRLPEGMEGKGTFELIPHEAPIVFRTFMKEAGLHAIPVGYPEQVHVAFDAEKVRWAVAWRGRFLDAEGTWDDRYTPLAEPLGTDVLHFPPGTFLPGKHQFRGYRLDAGGTPTFLYEAGGIQVEDRLAPDPTGKNLRRTLHLSGGSGRLELNAAGEKKVVVNFDAEGHATVDMEVTW